MSEDKLYRKKKNGRYEPVIGHDYIGFPCDGIWLVKGEPGKRSSSCMLQIGELPELYPFANMMMSKDELDKFLNDFFHNRKSYSVSELSKELFKFLSELNVL